MLRLRFLPTLAVVIIFSSCASTPLMKPGLNKRTVYIDSHPYLAQSIREAIVKGKVIEGMSFDDVRATWGEPDVMSTAEDSKLLAEDEVAWQYNRLFVVPIFVHFTNGVVTYMNDDYK